MNLKVRLALLYSLSVFIILMFSAVALYFLNQHFQKVEFTKRLVLEAVEIGELFYSVPQPTAPVLEEMEQNISNSLPEENIIIYDSAANLLYAKPDSASPHIPQRVFLQAKKRQQYVFFKGYRQSVLLYKNQKDKPYFILASARDIYGLRKNENLKILLSLSLLGGILLSGLLAFFYVKQAISPLEGLKVQMEKINEKNLKERIAVGNNNNEVAQIAMKFNAMLDRLEQGFEQRKNFVHHASHELRTPLANMLAQTESALNKSLSPEDYRETLQSLKEEQQDLINLTNSLLTLSRYEKITFAKDWPPVRIDEVLYETIDFAKQISPEAEVTIDFETMPENESELIFHCNESLIKSALQNLVKNAIHYSPDGKVNIIISPKKTGLLLQFENKGKQLSAEEQTRLFIPFFRGENSILKKGYGLGLSIVQRIINVHEGTLNYQAAADNINRFTVFLPKN